MKRHSLILASIGGAAVLATVGTALGVAAADDRPSGATALAAATATPTAAGSPDDSATSGTPESDPTSAPATGGTPTTGGTPATGAVDQRRAGEIALAEAGGGRIVEIEAEQEHGRPVWSVEILAGGTEHEVDVDRDTGAVLKSERESADDDDDGRDDHHDDDDRYDDDRDDDDD